MYHDDDDDNNNSVVLVCERTTTDRATAAFRRSQCLVLRIVCYVVSVTDPYDCIIGFLDRNLFFFFPVPPQLHLGG
jgi:hypothetical protein